MKIGDRVEVVACEDYDQMFYTIGDVGTVVQYNGVKLYEESELIVEVLFDYGFALFVEDSTNEYPRAPWAVRVDQLKVLD